MSSPTILPHWLHTGNMLRKFSPLSLYLNIPESFSLTRPFNFEWPNDETSFLPTTPPLLTSPCSGSKMPELLGTQNFSLNDLFLLGTRRPVVAGMMDSVLTGTTHAPTLTSAPDVKTPVTLHPTVPLRKGQYRSSSGTLVEALLHTCPTYAQDLIWAEDEDEEEKNPEPLTLALASEIMPPLPSVPLNELHNAPALNTIQTQPHLFCVSSSINIPVFHHFLKEHPN
jgi:hypothetical protein